MLKNVGGSSAFAGALMLGPRLGRYDKGLDPLPLGAPVNAVLGLFVLWWGWLAFNSGSTYGVRNNSFKNTERKLIPLKLKRWEVVMTQNTETSNSSSSYLKTRTKTHNKFYCKLSGAKYQYAAKAAVMTMIASFGGGCAAIAYSMGRLKGKIETIDIINGVLGSLVAITAGCFLYEGKYKKNGTYNAGILSTTHRHDSSFIYFIISTYCLLFQLLLKPPLYSFQYQRLHTYINLSFSIPSPHKMISRNIINLLSTSSVHLPSKSSVCCEVNGKSTVFSMGSVNSGHNRSDDSLPHDAST